MNPPSKTPRPKNRNGAQSENCEKDTYREGKFKVQNDDRPERSIAWRDEIQRPVQLERKSPSEFPQFLKDLLSCPPEHGQGVHQWLFKVARHLHAHRDSETICDLLAAAVDGCGRDVPRSEIADAVESAKAVAWEPTGRSHKPATRPRPKWPEMDRERIAELERQDPFALTALNYLSPVSIHSHIHDADCLLERLFPGDPLLCVAQGHPKTAQTLRRSEITNAGQFSHIVPSPMTKPEGLNKKGNPTPRCLENTGPRNYLVAEFDEANHGQQCAVIRYLATIAPLVMVVDSAGKSLHAWFNCSGIDETKIRKFFRYAVSLGADDATWTRCQLVRMPLGYRPEKEARQTVLYFDHLNTEHGKGLLK